MRLWVVALVALAGLGTGCTKPTQTAAEIFAKAQAAMEDERFDQALALIPSEALLEEMKADRSLRARFRLMQAELLAQRRDGAAGIAMLSAPLGAEAEVERQRRRSLGFARCRAAGTAEERQAGLAIMDEVLGESPQMSSEAGKVQLRRGTCLRVMGRAAEAEAALRAGLGAAKASREALLEAQVLSSLGSLCASGERFDEAAVYTKDALRAAGQAGMPGRHVTRRALDNLGWYQLELGDYERALDTLRQFQPQHERERVVNENNQARTLLAMEDFAGAAQHYEKALAAAKADTFAGEQVATMLGLSMVAYRQGKFFDAARWNREAVELARKLKQVNLERNGMLNEARIRLGQGDAAGAEPLLRKLVGEAGVPSQLRWSAHVELGQLLAGQGRNGMPEFEKAMELVEAGQAHLTAAEDRISFVSGRIEVYRQAMLYLVRQKRTDDALRVAERSRARAMQDKSARRVARSGATVLFYWLDEPGSHLWVVGAGGKATYFALPGAREIQELVERHNQFLLRARNPLTEGGQEARQLFAMLVRPALGQIGGRRVLISPDGGLHALNFETLVAPGPDHYWVEDVEVSVVSGVTGPAVAGRGRSTKGVLLAGDALEAEGGYGKLRHAGAELDRIGAQFGVKALAGAAATPRAVMEGLGRDPRIVHFAAHAAANRLRPLESAILLSPEAGAYKLYAREVARIPMRAELVTLSACTAAGAKAFRREGLVGFAWAFLGAGAENVVASLWEVDDASTPQLMEQMYRQMQLGRGPGEALREAKLALLRSGTALEKPYFWGAFLHFQR